MDKIYNVLNGQNIRLRRSLYCALLYNDHTCIWEFQFHGNIIRNLKKKKIMYIYIYLGLSRRIFQF